MCKAFIPLVGKEGRIVNLSSYSSALSPYSAEIRARFKDEKLTLEGLEKIASDYEVCPPLLSAFLGHPPNSNTLSLSLTNQNLHARRPCWKKERMKDKQQN